MSRLPLPDPMHLGYDEKTAEDAWRRMLAFFREHLEVPTGARPAREGGPKGRRSSTA
jgi:hypothetical protein